MVIPYSEIPAEEYSGFVFHVERIADLLDEIKPLHMAHWNETEGYRHATPLNADYDTFMAHERAGSYILFTARKEGALVGNCAMYLSRSTHTQTMLATEDTLFFLPSVRGGFTALRFQKYIERVLRALGVKEVRVSVKTINNANVLLERMGFTKVSVQYSKII